MNNERPVAKHDGVVLQELNGELLVYNLETNKAFCLNETSALIYQLSDGERSVSDIRAAAEKQTGSTTPEDLVWLALEGLQKEGLLSGNRDLGVPFRGTSRREVIKRVGAATMLALPLVTSLIAPRPAAAQSAGACAAQARDCTDAFVLAAPPGTPCTGLNVATPCSSGCTCYVRDNDPAGTDLCAP